MDQIVSAVAGSIATLLTVAGGYFTARRYARMGGGPAQLQLNATLKATVEALNAELTSLRRQLTDAQTDLAELARDFKACKQRLAELERYIASHAIRTDEADRDG